MRLGFITNNIKLGQLTDSIASYTAQRYHEKSLNVAKVNLEYPIIKFCEVMGFQNKDALKNLLCSENKTILVDYLYKTIENKLPDFFIVYGIRTYEEAKELQKINFQFIKIGETEFWKDIEHKYFIPVSPKIKSYTPVYKDMEIILHRLLDDLEIETPIC